jgi:hypothetical protein
MVMRKREALKALMRAFAAGVPHGEPELMVLLMPHVARVVQVLRGPVLNESIAGSDRTDERGEPTKLVCERLQEEERMVREITQRICSELIAEMRRNAPADEIAPDTVFD